MRVALLTNALTPYRLPVFCDLHATPGWSLRIFVNCTTEEHWREAFEAAWQEGRAKLDVVQVPSLTLMRRVPFHSDVRVRVSTHVPLRLLPALRRFRPDVVVSSELGARTLLAAAYARLFRAPLVVWSYPSRANQEAAGGFRRGLRRRLLARADAVIGMGRQAREVHRMHGVPEERLFDAPNAPDVAALERALSHADPLGRQIALRARIGARPRIALVAGRLIPMKGIALLLDAWGRLADAVRANWSLVFVGDGPLEPEVSAAARAAPPGEIVHVPAVLPERMAELYTAADLLLFPSLGDPWGLVVNEAQWCGRPVVCSRLAGCADDLVEPGVNGWLVDPCDPGDLARVLADALTSPDLVEMGRRGADRARRFTPEAMADGMRRAIRHAVDARSRRS